jgi:hypothetical protein
MHCKKHIALWLFSLIILCSCQYENAEELYNNNPINQASDTVSLESKIILDIPFSGTIDDMSDEKSDIIVHGDAGLSNDRFGDSNHALYLNGKDQYVEIDIEEQDSISVSFWFNCSSGASVFSSLFDYGRNAVKTNIDGYSGPTSFYVTSFYNNLDELHSDFYFQYFTWYHIYVSACNLPSIYVNGEKVGAIHKNIILNLTSTSLIFGKSVLNDSENEIYFHGLIDDIKIFNYAISKQEIRDLYHESIVKDKR